MGDSVLNVIFIIAVIAVFIVRTISSAKKKQEPEPKVKIPVHFEDDEEPSYFKAKAADEIQKKDEIPKKIEKKLSALETQPLGQIVEVPLPSQIKNVKKASAASTPKGGAVRATAAPAAAPVEQQKGFPYNLNRLSPMKQAVVMAEILGPPKALQ